MKRYRHLSKFSLGCYNKLPEKVCGEPTKKGRLVQNVYIAFNSKCLNAIYERQEVGGITHKNFARKIFYQVNLCLIISAMCHPF